MMASEPTTTTRRTRRMVKCPVFGSPRELPLNVLPTYEDVMKYYRLVTHQLKPTDNSKDPTFADVSEPVIMRIEELWHKSCIPIVSHLRVQLILRAYHTKIQNLLKSHKARKNNVNYQTKLQLFRDESKVNLFDISACKCVFSECNCVKVRKVPNKEQAFLQDQRTSRNMVIGSIDSKSSNQLKRTMERKEQEKSRIKTLRFSNESNNSCLQAPQEEKLQQTDDETQFTTDDEDYQDEPRPSTSKQLRHPVPALSRTADRYKVSDRAAAAIASSVLQDFGIVTKDDATHVVDRNKLRRGRQRKRKEVTLHQNPVVLKALYFDGRKDKTLSTSNEGKGTKQYRITTLEEHISLIQEPGSKYVGHFTPLNSSSAVNIEKGIFNYLLEKCIDTQYLLAVGCDGTNTNTGRVGGIIRLLEERLGKPLQWLICQLHANELPLRHLFQHLDGPTSGPKGFAGPIGKAFTSCERIPVAKFDKIETDLPEVTNNDLSTDQIYLLEICRAVASGECSTDLAKRNPGKIAHSRWLTLANRILRLYVATLNPSKELKELATYVVKVYAPMWFWIKTKPLCTNGASHLWRTINLSRYLSAELKEVVDPVIQRNGYFGHAENILLAMICDKRVAIRELGLRRILEARKNLRNQVRQFQVPILNFKAKSYEDLIDWHKNITAITAPPLLSDVSDDDIKDSLVRLRSGNGDEIDDEFADILAMEYQKLPCHTQSVERCVKLVTEAASAVCGGETRDGFIRVRLESRSVMPHFNTKAQFQKE